MPNGALIVMDQQIFLVKMTIWPAMNSTFAVCQDRAHGELTIVRRVPGKRHTANLNTLPCAEALGTRRRALLLGPA